MTRPPQICLECRRRPVRAADDFCSPICARAWQHDHSRDWHRVPPVVAAADNARIHGGSGVMRLNLQNSA